MIINRYYLTDGDKKSLGNSLVSTMRINSQETDDVLDYFRRNRINIMAPWEYVVKRELVIKNNIYFQLSQNGLDDSVFSPILFCHCNSFYLNDKPVYYWRQSESQQGRSHDKNTYIAKIISTFNSLSSFINKVNSDSKKNYIYFSIYKNIFSLFQFFNQYSELEKKELKRFFKKNKKVIKKSAQCSGRVHFLLFYILGPFYGMLLSYNLARLKGKVYKFVFNV